MARAWHHLPLSAVAVLWSLLLAGDYLGFKLEVGLYLRFFSEEQRTWFTEMPWCLSAAWGVGVWSGMLGAVLLTSRMSTGFFYALSFLGWAVMLVGLTWFREPSVREVAGDMGLYSLVAATVLAFLYFLYTRWMHVRWRRMGIRS